VATPQQNGVVERKHKHLLETSRALLFHSGLPLKYWGECVLTATYLINRFPSKVLNGLSPFQVLFGDKPSYEHLKVFGCLCYASTLKAGRDKFQARAVPCVFMGYPFGQKAYKLLNLETLHFFTSRDVVFHEHIFPFHTSSSTNTFSLFPALPFSCHAPDVPSSSPIGILSSQEEHPVSQQDIIAPSSHDLSSSLADSSQPAVTLADPSVPLRKSGRVSKTPSYLSEYVCHSAVQQTCCSHTVSSICCHASLSDTPTLSSHACALLHHLDTLSEPTTYEEAASKPEWLEAMSKEFAALEANNTWVLTDLPKRKKPISCKWVYRIKYKADGSLERYKARLVIRGFTQKAGIDYTETFSPVVKLTTVRALIATAVKMHWPLYQLDVNNAFLHGDLAEDIYMKPPPGLPLSSPTLVCKLQKSLYGLKQASRQWYAKLSDTLKSLGFQLSQNDYSLFSKQTANSIVFVAIYVDDIIVTGNDIAAITSLKTCLDDQFKIKDLGELNFFLGMEILKVSHGLVMSQKKFATELIKEFDCDDLSPVSCPLPASLKPSSPVVLLDDATPYRKLVGKLNYLTNTRPDIAFAVQYLSQFLQSPTQDHMQAALHTLRYVKKDPSQGLLFNDTADFSLQAFCDADWAQCPCTRRSVSGFVILFGGSLISWKSKKQPTVALSSAEAEYRSMRHVTAELAWLTRLLSEFQVPTILPVPVKSDSLAALYIARNPVFHERTKHIELDCHFVREKLQQGLISLSHIKTHAQPADLLTKPLPRVQHRFLLSKLGVSSSSPPT